MKWLFENGTVVFLVFVAVLKIVDALVKSRKAKAEHEAAQDPAAEQRRVQEVQEDIRRRIAQRRAGLPASPAEPARAPTPRPILRRPETTELPGPLGGPLRRVIEEMERKLRPPEPAPEPPPLVAQHRHAELERQQQLADQMKALEEARALAERRAAHLAEQKEAEAESEPRILTAARDRVLADLRDPQEVRRAFVLREVLGTPVGLRRGSSWSLS